MINEQDNDVTAQTAMKYLTQLWRGELATKNRFAKLCSDTDAYHIRCGHCRLKCVEGWRSFTSWLTESCSLFSTTAVTKDGDWPVYLKSDSEEEALLYDFAPLNAQAFKMEEQPSLPNVSIPCHNEQRDKKKRYTVREKLLFIVQFAVLSRIKRICLMFDCQAPNAYKCYCWKIKSYLLAIVAFNGLSLTFFQVYKVMVNVGQQEWFVFRRYAEFDKLYNTVSGGTMLFLILHRSTYTMMYCCLWHAVHIDI